MSVLRTTDLLQNFPACKVCRIREVFCECKKQEETKQKGDNKSFGNYLNRHSQMRLIK